MLKADKVVDYGSRGSYKGKEPVFIATPDKCCGVCARGGLRDHKSRLKVVMCMESGKLTWAGALCESFAPQKETQ